LEGLNPWKILSLNALRGKKSPKNEKTREKMQFSRADPPVFLPNRLILGLFLTVKLFCDLQCILHKSLATVVKTVIFQKTAAGCRRHALK
jgi:hypothetical protein